MLLPQAIELTENERRVIETLRKLKTGTPTTLVIKDVDGKGWYQIGKVVFTVEKGPGTQ